MVNGIKMMPFHWCQNAAVVTNAKSLLLFWGRRSLYKANIHNITFSIFILISNKTRAICSVCPATFRLLYGDGRDYTLPTQPFTK